MTWQDVFKPANWTDGFGATEGRSRPHRGTDLAVRTLVAWERLTVVNSDTFFSSLGYCMTLRADDGTLFGVAHCRRGTRAHNGAVLNPGDKIADAATGPRTLPHSNANFPGNEWAGTHFHITSTRGADVWGGTGLLDARPRILNAAGFGASFVRAPGGERGAPMWPVGPLMERIQRALANRTKFGEDSRYTGRIDGEGGELTAKGIQRTLNISRLNGVKPYVPTIVDGKLGINNAYGVQHYGAAHGGYRGKIDGDPLTASWTAFAEALEKP